MRRLLLFVTKNTSALDYAVPLVAAIRRRSPDVSVSVVYNVLARQRILRDFTFYSRVFASTGVAEYDLSDTLPRVLRPAVRRLFGRSEWDGQSSNAAVSVRRGVERRLTSPRRLDDVLHDLRPDTILLDHRTLGGFPGRDRFDAYVERSGASVVLLPHAPHHTGTEAFVPYSPDRSLPAFCDYWMPFIEDRTWQRMPEQRDQFFYAGYPGFDAEWIQPLRAGRTVDAGSVRCLFIIRKILRPGQRRPKGHDAFIFEYEEFAGYLDILRRAVENAGRPVEVVVKPHPSNDFAFVARLMSGAGLPRWSIAEDSIYAALGQIDCAVALYSTTLLATALAGVPTVLLHSRVQDEIQRWEPMARLYRGLRYYLADPARLVDVMPEVVAEAVRPPWPHAAAPDVAHVRTFFPDGATARAMERLGC